MEFLGIRDLKRIGLLERGSIAIEASVSMVVFTFAMMSILLMINVCRLQAHMGNAINRAALELSQYSYYLHLTGAHQAVASVRLEASDAQSQSDKFTDPAVLMGYAASFMGGGRGTFNEDDENDSSDFIRTLLLAGFTQEMERLGSEWIAAPITKAAVMTQLKSTAKDPDLFLQSHGVVDGLQGLDFSLSVFYPPESPCDIQLTVSYEVRIPFFERAAITVMQTAVTGAWLGGDETEHRLALLRKSGNPTDAGEESIWAKDALERGQLFQEIFLREHPSLVSADAERGVLGYDANSRTYYNCVSINTFSESYNRGGTQAAAACEHTMRKLKVTLNTVHEALNEGEDANVEYTVYIPEDTAQIVRSELQEYLNQRARSLRSEYPAIRITFQMVVEGGKANARGT